MLASAAIVFNSHLSQSLSPFSSFGNVHWGTENSQVQEGHACFRILPYSMPTGLGLVPSSKMVFLQETCPASSSGNRCLMFNSLVSILNFIFAPLVWHFVAVFMCSGSSMGLFCWLSFISCTGLETCVPRIMLRAQESGRASWQVTWPHFNFRMEHSFRHGVADKIQRVQE